MELEQIQAQLLDVLMAKTSQPLSREEIRLDTPLLGDGVALDSVSLFEFIVGIEAHFDVMIEDKMSALSHFENLEQLSRFVAGLQFA